MQTAARSRSWDPTQLSAKYPWLRVDSETLAHFCAPFEWVRDDAGERPPREKSSRSTSNSEASDPQAPRRRRLTRKRGHRLQSEADVPHSTEGRRRRGRASGVAMSKRTRALPRSARRDHGAADEVAPSFSRSLGTTRSETEERTLLERASSATDRSQPRHLPASVHADLQTLQRQAAKTAAAQKKRKKPPSLPSLRLPSLHRPTPPPSTAASPASLPHQLALAAAQQRALQRRVHAQIEAEKARLPLTFLFERSLDKTYCRAKCVDTITSIFAQLQHRMLFHAFHAWLTRCATQREQERRVAAVHAAQRRALALLERLASDAYVGTLDRAFRKWRATTRARAAAETQAAASKIQALYRQRRARVLLQDLKQASLDREFKRRSELQRLLRFELVGSAMKRRTLKNGFNLLLLSLCARRITLFFRRIRTRRVRQRIAAVTIQCLWRVRLAVTMLARLTTARTILRERQRKATIHIQRRARGYLARQHAQLRRLQSATESVCARLVQRRWRRHKDRAELWRRFAMRRRQLDEQKARREERERIAAARRDAARKDAMAVHLQRTARGFLGRRVARWRRRARDLDRAARRVQQSWRKSKGRFALHVRFVAQRERLSDRRHASALSVQCRVRVRNAQRQRDALLRERGQRRTAAVTIQRITRGRQARRALERRRRAAVAIQRVWRGRLARDERRRRLELRELAALSLQSLARGAHTRRRTRQLRSERARMARLLQQSAVLIQKRARGMEARKVALLLRRAMQTVDAQRRRAYANSTQRRVNESPLLAFLMAQYLTKEASADDADDDSPSLRYSREQLQWIQSQVDAAARLMEAEDRAAVLLQRRYRGYATRVAFCVMQVQRRERRLLESRAAATLRRVGRGFVARRRVHRLRAKRRGEELKDAYIRERRWKEQERAWQDQYRQEQMALQLQRLQTRERQMKDAKREAKVAKWQAEAAAARTAELQAQVEAKRLERALRGQASEEDEEAEAVWAYMADASGQWYYYNARTGESAWEKPTSAVEEKKKEKPEKQPQKKTPAAKNEKPSTKSPAKPPTQRTKEPPENAPVVEAKASPPLPEGFCVKCRAAPADKACLDCQPLRTSGEPPPFCTACFTLEHSLLFTSGGKPTHDFKVLRALRLPSRCQQPACAASPASYYCGACPEGERFSCEACFPRAHESAQTSHHVPAALHFRGGALRCVECQRVLATRQCAQCDEAFCASCFDVLHGGGAAKRAHEFAALEVLKDDLASERDAYCVDCAIRTCTRLCNLCGDGFCDACYAQAHATGQKVSHTWLAWPAFAAHGDWLEVHDDASGKTVFFNIETKESTHAQPFVLKRGDERHRVLFAEREAAMKNKALELESEIVKLQEQLQAAEEEKNRELERLKRRRRGGGGEDGEEEGGETKPPPRKRGLLGGLFGGGKKDKKKTTAPPAADKALSPDEAKRLALQQSVKQNAAELALIESKLMTRERAEKEDKAKRAVGTKQFEQAMLDQFAAS